MIISFTVPVILILKVNCELLKEMLLCRRATVMSSHVTGLGWPRGFQEVKVPRFHDNGTGWW